MKPTDGLELVRLVRDGIDDIDPGVPIIMLSGHTEVELVRAARDAGVNEFLAKSISAESLRSCLISVMENSHAFVQTSGNSSLHRRPGNGDSLGSSPELKDREESATDDLPRDLPGSPNDLVRQVCCRGDLEQEPDPEVR